MADTVAVRLAFVGGSQFRSEMQSAGAAGEQAMNRVAQGSRRTQFAVQNAAFQVGDFAVQMASGTSAARAFAQQAPQLLGSFGLIGALAGTGVAVVTALGMALLGTGQAAQKSAADLTDMTGSVGAVESAVSSLRETQNAYVEAINAQGGASSAAASLVIANSKAEFAARKEVLAVELELLRIRGVEKARDLQNLKDTYAAGAAAAAEADNAYRFGTQGATYTGFGGRRSRSNIISGTPNLDAYYRGQEQTRLAMRKIEAEMTLDNLALERGGDLMTGEFKDVASGGGTGKGRRGGGGKGGGANRMLEEGKKLFEATRTAAEKYSAEQAKLNDLLAQGAIDQDTYNRAMDDLRDKFDLMRKAAQETGSAFKDAFHTLFEQIADGSVKVNQILEDLAKKLAVARLEQAAFGLLAGVFPKAFGAGGFAPLVASAMGNVVDGGRVVPFAQGGIITRAHMFPMRGGGAGLMGEAGPEGILPLSRIGGKLGVNAAGMGGRTEVHIHNHSGQPVREERSRGPDGREIVRVIVGEEIARGAFDRPMRGRFGAVPAQVKR